MRRLVVVYALAAAACINIKPFNGTSDASTTGDGGPGVDALPPGELGGIGDVDAEYDGAGGVNVSGPGYTLHFDAGNAHFPDHYVVDGMELLATATSCSDRAGLMGAQVYPADSSFIPGLIDTSIIEIKSHGKSVARVTIHWVAKLTCGNVSVDSWWTFFPDGRISRADVFSASNVSIGSGCGCGNGTEFEVMNETRFRGVLISRISGSNDVTQNPTAQGGNNIDDRLCFTMPTFKLMTVDSPGPAPLLFAMSGDVGLVYRLTGGSAMLDGTIGAYYSEYRPMLQATSCDDVIAVADGFARYVALHVNGDTGYDTSNGDGIAGGFQASGSFGYTTDFTDKFTFEVKLDQPGFAYGPPGYAIGMVMSGAYPHGYTVERAISGGAPMTLGPQEARVQELDAGKSILWLRDGLPANHVVKVTPIP